MLIADPPADAPFGPFAGRWESSWGTVLRWGLGVGALVFVVMAGLGWLDGDAGLAAFGAGAAGIYVALEAVLYRLRGVAAVEVTPEALVVTRHGGAVSRVPWAEVESAHFQPRQMGDAWMIRHASSRLRVPERGFASGDWEALGTAVRYWMAGVPLATAPGVETARRRPDRSGPTPEGEVFRAHHPAALFWGIPFFAACAAVGLLSSWDGYRDGSWPDDLMLSVGLPMIGLGFVVMGLWGMTKSAKRVVFGPREMTVERLLGAPVRIPYGDVTDAFERTLRTRRGTFNLGERNTGTFHRLLDAHLADGQLSGEMAVQRLVMASQPLALVAVLVVPLVAAGALGWAYRLNEGAWTLLYIGLLIACGAAYVAWGHRRARRMR